MNGKKNDNYLTKDSKPMWHLLPLNVVEHVVKVLTFGAIKYGEDDWKQFITKGNNEQRYFSACLRHLTAWQRGENYDHETKQHHLAHALCCIIFILWKETVVKKR